MFGNRGGTANENIRPRGGFCIRLGDFFIGAEMIDKETEENEKNQNCRRYALPCRQHV